MATHFKSPLTVYVLWHPRFADGKQLADRLFNTLSRNVNDPFARTIGIPVYYRSEPAGAGSEAPAPIPLEESDYNAIVVFVDTQMLLSDDWKEYVKGILAKMEDDPEKTRVFPMADDFHSFKSRELGATNYIRMFEADDRDDMGTSDGDMDDDVTPAVDDPAIGKLEASLRAREANLAEREKAFNAREGSGATLTVGQPGKQGYGININITINNADPASGAVQLTGLTGAPDGRGENVAATDDVESTGIEVAEAAPKSTLRKAKSAQEILRRRGNLMLSKLLHELCRLIISPPKVTEAGTTRSAKPVNLFLSHAKADGAEIATQIKTYIEADSAMKTFFDANDIAPGYRFSNELKGAIETSALICIQTDHYATREWCLFEVITAKRFDRPVVVLNAVMQREPRSFPYIGNVPTMRWNPQDKSRFREVVDMALFEVLGNTYNQMFLSALQKLYTLPPGTHPVGHAPELFTILKLREKARGREDAAGSMESTNYILYPDPPLGDEEIQLLQDLSPDTHFITPTMLPAVEYQIKVK
jgi:hypothetical protein